MTFDSRLGPYQLGAEVLVRVAGERQTGSLTWAVPGSQCTLVFRGGRPERTIYSQGSQSDDRDHVVAVVRGFAIMDTGECRFETIDQPDHPHLSGLSELNVDTLGEVLMAIMENTRSRQLESFWQARGGWKVSASSRFARLLSAITSVGGQGMVAPATGTTVSALVKESVRQSDLPMQRGWLAMLVLGGLQIESRATEPAGPKGGAAPSRASSPAIRRTVPKISAKVEKVSADVLRLQREVETAYTRLEDQTHYEVLGVLPDVKSDALRKAYFDAAKRWHSDRMALQGLPEDVAKKGEELFRRCEEAYTVLNSPDDRKNYDFVLDRKARGLPTEAKVIFEAENLFKKAQVLVRRGQAAAAEPLLRQAVEMNRGEAQFWVYLGYAVHCARGNSGLKEAKEHIATGLELSPNVDSAYEFLGRIAHVEGHLAEAERNLRQSIEMNPNNVEAQRELRLLTMRKNKQDVGKKKEGLGGLLGKMLKR